MLMPNKLSTTKMHSESYTEIDVNRDSQYCYDIADQKCTDRTVEIRHGRAFHATVILSQWKENGYSGLELKCFGVIAGTQMYLVLRQTVYRRKHQTFPYEDDTAVIYRCA